MPDVLTLADKFRKGLEQQDLAVLARLIDTYGGLYARLQDKLKILALSVADLEQVTPAAVKRMAEYRDLMAQVAAELDRYQSYTGIEMDRAARAAITVGADNAKALSIAAGGRGIAGSWNRVPNEVIQQLLGFLDPQGPLYAKLGQLSGWTAGQVSKAILEGVGLGDNPKTIARALSRTFQDSMGMALTDSLRMMRTVQLYSYREAARASYVANGDVVTGWVWYAHLDGDVCLSCVAQHGTVHDNSETLDDHHNGRCDMLPLVIGSKNPIEVMGEEWFKGLPEAQQQAMMGASKWQAFKDGKFSFGALSREGPDDVYGLMRTETPLKDLVPE